MKDIVAWRGVFACLVAVALGALSLGGLSGCAGVEDGQQIGGRRIGDPQTVATVPLASAAHSGSARTAPLTPPPPLSARPDSPARRLAGHYRRVDYAAIPQWREDDLRQFWPAFLHNCQHLMRPVGRSLIQPARATPHAWHAVCSAAIDATHRATIRDSASIRHFLQTHLQPWQLVDTNANGVRDIVTGYYEPLVRGSRQPSHLNQWPLYTPPPDLLTIDLGSIYPALIGKRVRGKRVGKRIIPYDTRAQLAQAAHQPPVLVYVSDPVDNLFLQIQGSGRVQLTDGPDAGKTIRLAYADHNGQPYVSVGRWLVEQGELGAQEVSMQNIRAWAKRHPARVPEMLNANPAVVFFQEAPLADPEQGPRGAYGVPLTPQRSIAVDTAFVPLGTPVFLATTWPQSQRPLNRLTLAQDTGTAIRGAGRVDFFWGFGEEAGQWAGRMKQSGQIWLLWPRQAGEPSAR